MFAFIFVHPSGSGKIFKLDSLAGVDQTEPLKRLALEATPRPPYATADRVLEAGAQTALGEGIYGTRTEGSMTPQFAPVDGAQEGSDYDILTLSGDEKDPWGQIIATGVANSDPVIGRVIATFPKLTDADLQAFAGDRSIG